MWSTRYASDGLLLRAWEPGDGPALAAAKRASYEHLAPWMPWAEPDPDEAAEEKRVRLFAGKWLIGEDALVSIWTPDGATLLGGSGFHPREGDYSTRQAEIGMWIAGPAAGQGVGTRALRAMLRWGFGSWGFLRLSWICNSANVGSRRVAEKAGMLLEGTRRGTFDDVSKGRRDELLFAALAPEWRDPGGLPLPEPG
ncbi:MAG: GNAT family N-acetyltransferase [Planctomycetota bacterium]